MDTTSSNFKFFYEDFKKLMKAYNIPYYIFKTPEITMCCGMMEPEKEEKDDN